LDGQEFDALTRELASSQNRRGVLRSGAALLASVAGIGIGHNASARSLRKEGQTCRSTSDCSPGNCLIATDGRKRCIVCRGDTVLGPMLNSDPNIRDGCCLPDGAPLPGGCDYNTVFDCCVYEDREIPGAWWIGCDPDTGTCVNAQDVHPTERRTNSNLIIVSV